MYDGATTEFGRSTDMGQLVDGVWQKETLGVRSKDGRFVRVETQFRDFISADGASGFKAEAGRYHLYVSLACPWAHRTLIFRVLKGLREAISISVVSPFMADEGWTFGDSEDCIADPLFNARHLHEIYTRALQDYSGRVTVPVLWDRERGAIVNNESAEIIRMMNSTFAALAHSGWCQSAGVHVAICKAIHPTSTANIATSGHTILSPTAGPSGDSAARTVQASISTPTMLAIRAVDQG